jgi:hypothetical protein
MLVTVVATLTFVGPSAVMAQAPLQITSPPSGSTFQPGDTIDVVVTSPAGLSYRRITTCTFSPSGELTIGTAVPFATSVEVTPDTSAGVYKCGALGVTTDGQRFDAVPITLFIEHRDRPTAVTADPARLYFGSPGSDLPVRFVAQFADGIIMNVTRSSRLAYTTSNERVMTVDDEGNVTAVGVGSATLLATYTPPSGAPVLTTIPVTVEPPDFSATPGTVEFGSQTIGDSTSRSVVLTNRRRGAVAIQSVAAGGDFAVQSDCVANSPIQSGATCTAVVTFTPSMAGSVRGFLRVSTDFSSGQQGIALFGEGLGLRASATGIGSSINPSVLGQPVTVTATVTDAAGGGTPAPSGTVTIAEGATTLGSGVLAGGAVSTTVTSFGIGSHAITAAYSGDTAFGPSTSSTLTQVVRYAAAGAMCHGEPGHQILQPVNADGTSVFNQGRTVPAKFRVCDAGGQSIGTPSVVQDFRLTQVISGTTSDVNENVPSTTPDAAFRWDPSEQLWIFNISTAGQDPQKTYVYSITLNDGTTIGFRYGLR